MNALAELKHVDLEDFLLTLRFPDFCTQQLGGFINIVLRGLLWLNYDNIYKMPVSTSGTFPIVFYVHKKF